MHHIDREVLSSLIPRPPPPGYIVYLEPNTRRNRRALESRARSLNKKLPAYLLGVRVQGDFVGIVFEGLKVI